MTNTPKKFKRTTRRDNQSRTDKLIRENFTANVVISLIFWGLFYLISKNETTPPRLEPESGYIVISIFTLTLFQGMLLVNYFRIKSATAFYSSQSIGVLVFFIALSWSILWFLSREETLGFSRISEFHNFIFFSIVGQLILSVWLFFKSTWYKRTIYALSNDKHHAYDIITKKLNPFGFNGAFIGEYSRNRFWLVAMPMAGFLAYGVVSLLFPGWGKILLVYIASFLITFGGVGLAMQGITSYLFVRKIEKRYNIRFVVGEVKFPATRTLSDEGRQPE
ncbi:hypothetical protein [Rheinheimera aquimaris]|jgi:hypothetical protein|uniref:hypothetical protein n=1 Tax=Rheinheimera aquimaris TaxID=412437 RepID=UPI001064EF72|nr:hypothetical protein [Rheinheimera aquimaris]|tara:strand:- start:4715 stop:5548 length:834 start_codon:yes stop_codon:yes gene_type:complete